MRWHAALAMTLLFSGVAHAQGSGGAIKGRVLVRGTAPAARKVPVKADLHCQQQHPQGLAQSDFAISNGGLADVLVHLKTGVQGTFPASSSSSAVLDQKGCQYSPSMVAVQAGQALKIRNSDPTLHNVHFRPALNKEVNVGQPRPMESSRVFAKPEVLVPIGCDVHPWMRAHLAVLAHPFFAVSTEGGAFAIRNVPPGRYEIEARHGKLRPVSATVTVSGAETPVELTLVIE